MSIERAIGFLSTPYESHPGGLDQAYDDALRLTARLTAAQPITVFSPVVYCHQVALVKGGKDWSPPNPRDRKFWMAFIRPFVHLSMLQWVAHMPNWENSEGIADETGHFETAGKLILDLNPETLTWANRERIKPIRDRYDFASVGLAELDAQKRDYLGHAPR